MRRVYILFFWILGNRNNISFKELVQFLSKPKINAIAKRFIQSIENKADYEVTFKAFPSKLYWPKSFTIDRLDQVVSETFDENDWHYYQKKHTEVVAGDIILDIGTAEGLFPLTVIDKVEKIYMIEPSGMFYNCLKKTFAPFEDKVSIINVAVGNQDGEIMFDENSLDGKVSENDNAHTHKIAINKIDTLFATVDKITYLKADIEGFEQEMLKGAGATIKKHKPKIAITTYHTQNNPNEIIAIIKGFVPEYNYYVKGIYEQTPKPVMIHFWI